jgi:hypothetical protein
MPKDYSSIPYDPSMSPGDILFHEIERLVADYTSRTGERPTQITIAVGEGYPVFKVIGNIGMILGINVFRAEDLPFDPDSGSGVYYRKAA